jgi:MazG family protein
MEGIYKLLQIMSSLRDPDGGCPWDREQDFKSIAGYTLQEVYEVIDAIERDDMGDLCDELGDILFHIVFYAQMANEEGYFDFTQVLDQLNQKLERRHPHVFGDARVKSTRDQSKLWENLKREERLENDSELNRNQSILDGIGPSLPAIMRAEKLQKRAAGVGFDWPDSAPVFAKIEEELDELRSAVKDDNSRSNITEELGDLLFSCVNLARHINVDSEMALRNSNRKFEARFHYIEQQIAARGKRIEDINLEELDSLWEQAKNKLIE